LLCTSPSSPSLQYFLPSRLLLFPSTLPFSSNSHMRALLSLTDSNSNASFSFSHSPLSSFSLRSLDFRFDSNSLSWQTRRMEIGFQSLSRRRWSSTALWNDLPLVWILNWLQRRYHYVWRWKLKEVRRIG
jgi:hypothetical protein